jgi:lipoprotein-anchoring transpeptidase ErfK/SrfK
MVYGAAAAVLAVVVTACTGAGTTAAPTGNTGTASGGASAASASASAAAAASASAAASAAAAAAITIAPGNGGSGVDPSPGITVSTAHGTLKSVSVQTPGDPVTGTFSADHGSWHSDWALNVSQSYTVTATATSAGGVTVTKTAKFKTLTPASTFFTHIFEGYQLTYGVGMPIMLTFSQPITNRAAVERSIELKTSKQVIGAWYWDGSQTLVFRPRQYWPAHTTVSFTGHFDGVQAAKGMYGYHTLTQSFSIGDSVIAVASTRTHRTQIYINGKKKYDWPISTGKPGDETPDGSYLTIEKANPVEMKGPGYDLMVPFSVRFTWSGDYYHYAPWSVGVQGAENVSHGCVNLGQVAAETYYNLAMPGDPVTIKGSPRAGAWDNGWTYWFLTWSQLLKGSATHMAVVAGPDGSKSVDPATLPASTAKAPVQIAATGNYIA